jgi:hypothetical protein
LTIKQKRRIFRRIVRANGWNVAEWYDNSSCPRRMERISGATPEADAFDLAMSAVAKKDMEAK